MFLGGWFLRNDGWERLKEDVTGKYRERPIPGEGPLALGPDGYYWGVTSDANTMPGYLYKMKGDGSDWQIVHTFQPEGSPPMKAGPQGAVVFDGVDSMLGTTVGRKNSAEWWKECYASQDPRTTVKIVYPAGRDTLYKVNVMTGVFTTVVEFTDSKGPYLGREPRAALVPDGLGSFWGSTMWGGTNDRGTIFKFHPATGVFTTVTELSEGVLQQALTPRLSNALTSDGKGWWWGLTGGGGKEDLGTIFKVKADTGELTTVAEFTKNRGGLAPEGSLVSDGRGCFWGVCTRGGQGTEGQGVGTVFKVDAITGALTTMVVFTGGRGRNPGYGVEGPLVDDGQGFLWGCTQMGGSGSGANDLGGTLFKVDITSGALTTLVEFQSDESRNKGWWPCGTLVNDGHGAFLGTTLRGGNRGAGTIFKVDVKTGVLTTLVEFGKVGP